MAGKKDDKQNKRGHPSNKDYSQPPRSPNARAPTANPFRVPPTPGGGREPDPEETVDDEPQRL